MTAAGYSAASAAPFSLASIGESEEENTAQRLLKYCHASRPDECFPFDRAGDPVFPVMSGEDKSYLAALAHLYGAVSHETVTAPGSFEAVPQASLDWGTVLCLDASLHPAARLYAALTGRRLITFEGDAVQLPGALTRNAVEILFFRYADWTSDFVRIVQRVSHARQGAIGLIPAQDSEDAFRQAVRRAAALYLSQDAPEPARTSCIGVLPGLSATAARTGSLALIGNNAPADLLDNLLGCGSDILAIATHSDGRDSPLPGGRVLCGIKGRRHGFEAVEPLCAVTKLCHRTGHKPLEEALRSSQLLAASSLRAKLLFYRACHVLPPTREGLPAGESLAQALLDQSVFGCLVTAVGVIFVSDLRLAEELALLRKGGDVGTALARLAQHDEDNPTRPHYFCFGDPRLMIAKATAEQQPAAQFGVKMTIGSKTSNAPGSESPTLATLEALRDPCLVRLTAVEERNHVEEAWSRLIAASATKGNHRDIAESFAACLRLVRWEFVDAWLGAGATWRRLTSRPCPHCRSESQVLQCTFGVAKVRRVVVNCFACGIAEDRPEQLTSGIRVSARGILTATDGHPLGARLFLRIHAHQQQGPAIEELSKAALHRGYAVWSTMNRAMPAQLSVFTIRHGEFTVATRNVTLLPRPGTGMA